MVIKLQAINCPTCGASLGDTTHVDQPFQCPSCGSTLVLTDLCTADQLVCRSCGAINHRNERHCRTCGTPLTAACPLCYAQNSIDTIYCQTCGYNLQQAWQRKRAWLEEKRRCDQARLAAAKEAEARSEQAKLSRWISELEEPQNHPLAIYCLHRLGSTAVEPLLAALRSPDVDARVGAARALGLIGDLRAVPALIDLLRDAEPSVRYWAVDTLGLLRAQEAAEPIAALLRDNHGGVRARAHEVLQKVLNHPASDRRKQARHPSAPPKAAS